MMSRLLPALALTLAAVFFGIALYISLAEQPARLALADLPLLQQWQVSFGVGFALQGSLTLASGVAGLGASWVLRDWRWGLGGLLMLCNWPWTLVLIAPTNAALLALAAEAAGPASRALIEHWGILHVGRVALSLGAVGFFVLGFARPATHGKTKGDGA